MGAGTAGCTRLFPVTRRTRGRRPRTCTWMRRQRTSGPAAFRVAPMVAFPRLQTPDFHAAGDIVSCDGARMSCHAPPMRRGPRTNDTCCPGGNPPPAPPATRQFFRPSKTVALPDCPPGGRLLSPAACRCAAPCHDRRPAHLDAAPPPRRRLAARPPPVRRATPAPHLPHLRLHRRVHQCRPSPPLGRPLPELRQPGAPPPAMALGQQGRRQPPGRQAHSAFRPREGRDAPDARQPAVRDSRPAPVRRHPHGGHHQRRPVGRQL